MRAELLWFFCGNFHIFVTMATGVGLTQISFTQLNRQFPKTPIWRKSLDDILYTSWVIADFQMKFIDFCYHGNQGGSSENLNDSIGLADPEYPHTGAKFWELSEMRAELLWFLCGNFHIFVTMATGVDLTQISLTQLNRQFRNPYLAQESWRYLIQRLSYSRLSDEIYRFLLPWQPRWV